MPKPRIGDDRHRVVDIASDSVLKTQLGGELYDGELRQESGFDFGDESDPFRLFVQQEIIDLLDAWWRIGVVLYGPRRQSSDSQCPNHRLRM